MTTDLAVIARAARQSIRWPSRHRYASRCRQIQYPLAYRGFVLGRIANPMPTYPKRHSPDSQIWNAVRTELSWTHQDIGQMDMYVRMVDNLKRAPDANPTVGIILCAGKDAAVVRYSVLHENEQLFASKYKLVLPFEDELSAELEKEQLWLAEQKEVRGKDVL